MYESPPPPHTCPLVDWPDSWTWLTVYTVLLYIYWVEENYCIEDWREPALYQGLGNWFMKWNRYRTMQPILLNIFCLNLKIKIIWIRLPSFCHLESGSYVELKNWKQKKIISFSSKTFKKLRAKSVMKLKQTFKEIEEQKQFFLHQGV